jgi:hypothetical protein
MDLFGEQMNMKDNFLKQIGIEKVVDDVQFDPFPSYRRATKPRPPIDISTIPYVRSQLGNKKNSWTMEAYKNCKPKIKDIKPLPKNYRNKMIIGKITSTSPLGSYLSPNSELSLMLNDKQKQIVYSQMYYESPPTPEMLSSFMKPSGIMKPVAPRVSLGR